MNCKGWKKAAVMAQLECLFLVFVWKGLNLDLGVNVAFAHPWWRLSGCCVMNEMSPAFLDSRLAPYSWCHVVHRKHIAHPAADGLSVRASKVNWVAKCVLVYGTQYCAVFLFLCLFSYPILLLFCFFHFFSLLICFAFLYSVIIFRRFLRCCYFPYYSIVFSAFITYEVSLHRF